MKLLKKCILLVTLETLTKDKSFLGCSSNNSPDSNFMLWSWVKGSLNLCGDLAPLNQNREVSEQAAMC